MKKHTVRKDGIATLELVMVFPILMFLVAILFTLQMTLKKQASITTQVRYDAWQLRSDPSKLVDGNPFGAANMNKSGSHTIVLRSTNNMYRKWYPSVSRVSIWGNTVLNGSWDHREVDFSGSNPHMGVTAKMASGNIEGFGDWQKLNDIGNIFKSLP